MATYPSPPQEVFDDLKAACNKSGSQSEFALDNDLPPGHVSRWVNGQMSIPNHVLNIVGWERVIEYRRIS